MKKKETKKTSIFTHGYNECRERVSKTVKYSRSCFNCASYYKDFGDDEEVCQNPEVTKFDIVVDGNNIYCTYWKPSSSPETQHSMFKRGRGRLD